MTLFRNKRKAGRQWPQWLARIATIVIYTGYAGGALLRLVNDSVVAQTLGLLLIAISVLTATAFTSTYFYRLTHEPETHLDERERQVRNRAYFAAYAGVASAMLIGLIYLQVAPDFGWWFPTLEAHWNAIFWGAALLAIALPAACLVWLEPAPEDPADAS
jgi:hypothetical protein